MKPSIAFTRVWADDDVVELEVAVCDGISVFRNQVYEGHAHLDDVATDLESFKIQIHGGLLDIELGSFGPECANGAFHARLHFPDAGLLYISCKQQSDFKDFSRKSVAAEASLYLKTEPALLDRFIVAFALLAANKAEAAVLEAI